MKLLLTLVLILGMIGCAAEKRVAPIKTDFLAGTDTSQKIENLPFEHSWVRPGVSAQSYSQLFLKPVRLDYLPKDAWRASASGIIKSEEDYLREAESAAENLRNDFVKNINAQPGNRFSIVDKPGPQALVVEVAIVELEFSHPAARAAALAVPVPGSGAVVGAVTDPHVLFAAKISDGASGELIATVADRRFAPLRIIDFNKLTVTSSVREICDNWSKTVAVALNSKPGEKTTQVGRFALLPW